MTIYIMNVFVTLFNEATNDDEVQASCWKIMVEILVEIELFHLLPFQRRWQKWFPEVIYYSASLDEAQEEIVKLINEDKWNTNEFSDMKKDLLNKLKIQQN